VSVKTPVYLDHHATTPLDPRVREVLERVQRDHFGNPSSSWHAPGWAAARLVEEAREKVAALVGATASEIIFTSGATEAANLALLGVAGTRDGRASHLVTSVFEHEAVSGPVAELESRGWRVTRVGCGSSGRVKPADVEGALRPDTVLVAVMAAQNEIGTVQPLGEMGALCKDRGVLVSAHKLYGPKGTGALFVRRRDPRVTLSPLTFGGGQERGIRPGTLNVPGIAAFGEACLLARGEMATEAERLSGLRDFMFEGLVKGMGGVHLNGSHGDRLPGNLNVSFEGVRAHRLLGALTTLAVSSSSACSSAATGPSAVLEALGVPEDLARASLRVGIGRFTTEAEVDYAVRTIVEAVLRLRKEG
jgi:cysteine desulfurase